MAEGDPFEDGSGDGGRPGKRERAHSTQKNMGNLLVVVLAPGNHRRAAGDHICEARRRVNVGRMDEKRDGDGGVL
jgi:hypothetical protein